MVAQVRGYNQAGHSTGTSLFIPFHASTVAGDTVIIGASTGLGSTLPSGWTNLVSSNTGSYIRYRLMWKVVDSTDVAAGGVTMAHSSGQCMAIAVSVQGATGAPVLGYNIRDSSAGGLPTGLKSATGFDATSGSLGVYVGHGIYSSSPTAPTIARGDAGASVSTGVGASRMQSEEFPSALTGQVVDYTYAAGTLQGYAITQCLVPGAPPDPPGAPSAVVTTDITADTATLSWSAPGSGGPLTGYEYRLNGGTAVDAGAVLTTPLTGLTPSTDYTPEVRSYGPGGTSSWVAGAEFTTLSVGASAGWWDGDSTEPATFLGWWDGDTTEPATLLGWWDGADIQPLA